MRLHAERRLRQMVGCPPLSQHPCPERPASGCTARALGNLSAHTLISPFVIPGKHGPRAVTFETLRVLHGSLNEQRRSTKAQIRELNSVPVNIVGAARIFLSWSKVVNLNALTGDAPLETGYTALRDVAWDLSCALKTINQSLRSISALITKLIRVNRREYFLPSFIASQKRFYVSNCQHPPDSLSATHLIKRIRGFAFA